MTVALMVLWSCCPQNLFSSSILVEQEAACSEGQTKAAMGAGVLWSCSRMYFTERGSFVCKSVLEQRLLSAAPVVRRIAR
jgi:hypothetical protein